MLTNKLYVYIVILLLLVGCKFPTAKEVGVRYRTVSVYEIPEDIMWQQVGISKELFNKKNFQLLVSGAENPISLDNWKKLSVGGEWQKMMDRRILADEVALTSSPGPRISYNEKKELKTYDYKGNSWYIAGEVLSVDFIPSSKDLFAPTEGALSIAIVRKCEVLLFKSEIYELTDNQGNFYVMNATEIGVPDLRVVLPNGWSLVRKDLSEPLTITPFGDDGNCYYNILFDHLGQSYYQYKYNSEYYPSN